MPDSIRFEKAVSASVIHENIEAVANMEQQFLRSRSIVDRVIDAIADFTGSLYFVGAHLVWFTCWCTVNSVDVPGIPHFDPFPFVLLSMTVSCEAVILSALVLMKQNRMAQHSEEREHLHLQINLLAEKESTKIIQMLRLVCKQLGIAEPEADPVTRELSQDTAVDHLAAELREKIHEVPAE